MKVWVELCWKSTYNDCRSTEEKGVVEMGRKMFGNCGTVLEWFGRVPKFPGNCKIAVEVGKTEENEFPEQKQRDLEKSNS